jgi:hypothetical protein
VPEGAARVAGRTDAGGLQIDRAGCEGPRAPSCQLGDRLAVHVRGSLADWRREGNLDVGGLRLLIDGLSLDHLAPRRFSNEDNALVFVLDPHQDNERWKRLLAGRDRTTSMHVALADSAGGPISNSRDITFVVRPWYTPLVYVFLIVLVGTICLLARRSDLLRDRGPEPGGGLRKPYSLARTQLAVWTVVVTGSYLFIWAMLGNASSLNDTALVLLGISAATGLAANVIDVGASSGGAGRPATSSGSDVLPATPAPAESIRASRHFLVDILSDDRGVSVYRFQMALWTLVLAFVFLYTVWRDLAMADFNGTLLGLLGISNGTYVGFKLPGGAK